MSKILDDLMAHLESEEGKKELEDFLTKKAFEEEINDKIIDKYRSMSLGDRLNIFNKIYKKYSSKEYIDREYNKCGCQPREELFWLFLKYGELHGTELDINWENGDLFVTERWLLPEENIIVERLDGQGSMISIYYNESKSN